MFGTGGFFVPLTSSKVGCTLEMKRKINFSFAFRSVFTTFALR